MPTRFVILHHKTDSGEHWDLMLERADVLLTWQLLREPSEPSCLPVPARRIADHRKAYLDYEGPISGGRGQVFQVDAGTVEFEKLTVDKCIVSLQGNVLGGRYSLARDRSGENEWSFDKAPDH